LGRGPLCRGGTPEPCAVASLLLGSIRPQPARGPRCRWDGCTARKITSRIASVSDPPASCRMPGEDQSSRGGHSGVLSPPRGPRCCQPGRASLGELGSAAKPQRGAGGCPLPPLPPWLFLAAYPAGRVPVPLAAGGDGYSGQEEPSEEPCQGCGAAFGPSTAPLRAGKPGFAAAGGVGGGFTHFALQCRDVQRGQSTSAGAKQECNGDKAPWNRDKARMQREHCAVPRGQSPPH